MFGNFDIFRDKKNDCFQLRTKTEGYTVAFDDLDKEEIFLTIVTAFQNNPFPLAHELRGQLIHFDNHKVVEVLTLLHKKKLLPPHPAFNLSDHTTDGSPRVTPKKKCDIVLSIMGSGELSKTLLKTSKKQAFKSASLYAYKNLIADTEIEALIIDSDFLIVDGNEWSPYHTELINQYALKHNKPWLYIGGLERTAMKIGPLFYGRETGCYHCFMSRIKSNCKTPSLLDAYEHHLKIHKKSSKPDMLPNRDLVYAALANLTLLEVMKFFLEWSLPVTWKTLLSFEVTSFQMTKHALLKKPFCEVCKPELEYNPTLWLDAITLK